MRLSDYTQSGGRGLFRRDRRLFDQRGTFTFTIPEGVTQIWAFAMGAGGGASTANVLTSGKKIIGGGKGGGYASGIISGLTPGGTLTITVGAGGNGKINFGSATAGADTTVVGGSTTYLQGEGGGAGGAEENSITDQKGQGGTAATSSVTDAYTAAGGGSGSASVNFGPTSDIATGGGASGNPFGTGMGGGKAVQLNNNNMATGGGGWAQKDFPHTDTILLDNNLNIVNGFGFPGYGSHTPPSTFFFSLNSDGENSSGNDYPMSMRGGNGRSAKGGISLMCENYIGNYFDGGQYQDNTVLNYYKAMTDIAGGDANPNWWFPWEIDGGGGGGSRFSNYYSPFMAGNGGPGGGGGGCGCDGGSEGGGSLKAGDGGFGGGGGGMYAKNGASIPANQNFIASGGNGGNGGGGGAAKAPQGSGNDLAVGGNGGDGCVGLYW